MMKEKMIFDKQVWNIKEIYKPQEIKEKIESFNLKGRVIKDIKAVGMDYAHGEVDVEDAVDYLFETYYPEALDDNSAYNMFIDDLPFRRYMEIDQPFIIKFDNNETFEIVADWSPLYAMSMNSLPWDIEPAINYQNADANIIFSNCIGEEIINIEIVTSLIGFEEGERSTIVCLETGTEYVSKLILWLSNGMGISVSPYYDFTHVE